jgi:hypothetical protein
MNTAQAREKADTVVTVQIGSSECARYAYHAEAKKPIRHLERMAPEKCGMFNILGGRVGLPGEAIFYLERII